jgi:putative ABC transport system ATP-binding protein
MQDINRRSGTTFIFSTHDKKVMSRANRLIRIEDGRVYQLGMRQEAGWVFARPPQSRRRKTADAREREEVS